MPGTLCPCQMIVTTPEKWDVITRKGGEVSVAASVRLLIIGAEHRPDPPATAACCSGAHLFALNVSPMASLLSPAHPPPLERR